MFPTVSGWTWTPIHVVFVSVFLTIASVVALTVILAAFRAWRDIRKGKAEAIRWHSEFEDLPARDRVCRHEITNEFLHRVCDQGFDCRSCPTHATWITEHPVNPATQVEVAGLRYPVDRLYHRGHTWVKPDADGTLLIGPDALSERMFGRIESVTLPPVGSKLRVNAPAWTVSHRNDTFRILAPVDGVVVDHGAPDSGYYLRVRPTEQPVRLSHLLRDAEVRPWVLRELERFQMLVAPGLPSLADGGTLVDDPPAAAPEVNWSAVWGEMLLEP